MSNEIKPYTWIVRFDIAPMWVADGATISDLDALDMLSRRVDFGDLNTEMAAAVIAAPCRERLLVEMGYTPDSARFEHERSNITADCEYAYPQQAEPGAPEAALDWELSNIEQSIRAGEIDQALFRLEQVKKLVSGARAVSDITWHPAE